MLNHFKSLSESSRNILVLASGTTLAQSIPIAVSPILTRIFSPEDFGILAVYIAIVTILSVVVTGRYEQAIMLPKSQRDAVHIVILSMFIALIFSLICLAGVLFFHEDLRNLTGNIDLGNWLYFIPLSIFIAGCYNTLYLWNNRFKNYNVISQSKIIQTSGMSISQLSTGALKFWSAGLILGWIAGQLLAVFFLVYKLLKLDKIKFYDFNKLRMIALAQRYKDFPRINSISGLLNSSSLEAPLLILSALFGAITTGFFSLAQRILQMPMALIGTSFGHVYFEQASKVKDDKDAIRKLSIAFQQKLIYLGAPPIAVLILWGDSIFSFIFGNQWIVAGQYAQSLSIWIFFVFVSSPLSHLLTIYEKHWESVNFNLALLISRVSSLIVVWYFFDNPNYVVAAYGLVGAIVWCLFIFYLMKLANVTYFETAKKIIPVTLILILLHFVGYI